MSIDRFRQNQRVSADQLNRMRQQILANKIVGSGGGITVSGGPAGRTIGTQNSYVPRSMLCVVTDVGPEGDDDYTDARYWVRGLACTNEDGDAIENLTMEAAEALDENGNAVESGGNVLWGFWETATNLSEWLTSGHGLNVGHPVIVYPLYDSRLDSNLHWVFSGGSSRASGIRPGKITSRTVVYGPTSAHKYKGVYVDAAAGSWGGQNGIQCLGDRDGNIRYSPMAIDAFVGVVVDYNDGVEAQRGVLGQESPVFIACTECE